MLPSAEPDLRRGYSDHQAAWNISTAVSVSTDVGQPGGYPCLVINEAVGAAPVDVLMARGVVTFKRITCDRM